MIYISIRLNKSIYILKILIHRDYKKLIFVYNIKVISIE